MASSWLKIDPESPFSLSNLPFGIFSTSSSPSPRPAIAIGDYALDLAQLHLGGTFSQDDVLQTSSQAFLEPTLNDFAALGRPLHQRFRLYIRELLLQDTAYPALLKENDSLRTQALFALHSINMHLPLAIGDYTDFYAGRNHAHNLGVLLRGYDNALQPNYLHLPVGYHGRASSVQVSGSSFRRPSGQTLAEPGAKTPIFGPSKKLDMELEIAAFLCRPNDQGSPVDVNKAESHIFGFVLMNDWSARDIQAWEYVPLGPFNSKNFATTISPWIVLADAMEPFRTRLKDSPDNLLPYLRQTREKTGYDIDLSVDLVANGQCYQISNANAKYLCYSFEQMVAHHSITGCPLRTGDLFGSGTISGEHEKSLGSLMEITRNGKQSLSLGNGVSRTFLEDGDEIVITGKAGEPGAFVGFGPCRAAILPALTS